MKTFKNLKAGTIIAIIIIYMLAVWTFLFFVGHFIGKAMAHAGL